MCRAFRPQISEDRHARASRYAVATVILAGFGLKLTFFCGPIAAVEVGSTKSVNMDVSEMHHEIKNLPSGKVPRHYG
jgi:hypothetical protein